MMRLNVILVLALVAMVFAVRPAHDKFHHVRHLMGDISSEIQTRMYDGQRVDHFDPTNQDTWSQRFFVNMEFYKPGGPVFLMIGGEGEESPASVDPEIFMMCKNAEEFNAACVCLEHRYYGESQIFASTMDAKNMVYLSTSQGLADLTTFKAFFTQEYNIPTEAKWIAFGGSYPGSLAAFARIKYPHHFHAASSASAPVRPKFDYIEYMGVVRDVFKNDYPEAFPIIRDAFNAVDGYLDEGRDDDLITLMKAQLPDVDFIDSGYSKSVNDRASLVSSLTNQIALTVQYAKGEDLSKLQTDITGFYADIDENDEDRSLKAFLQTYNKWGKANKEMAAIVLTFSDVVEGTAEDLSAGRHWTWQCCTEYAYWQTSNLPADDKFIGSYLPLSFFQDQCKQIFNIEEDSTLAGIKRATIEYGSLNPHGTRIFYFNGGGDPWHALSVGAGNGADAKRASQNGVVVPHASHCMNMYNPEAHPGMDYQELADAREAELKHLRAWLKEDSASGRMEVDEL